MPMTTDGRMALALPESDWAEIYYALDYKLHASPAVRGQIKWEKQLKRMMKQLAEQMNKHGLTY